MKKLFYRLGIAGIFIALLLFPLTSIWGGTVKQAPPNNGVRFYPQYQSHISIPAAPSLDITTEFTIKATVQWLGTYSPEYNDWDSNIITRGDVGLNESQPRYGYNLLYGYYSEWEGYWEIIIANGEQTPSTHNSERWDYLRARDDTRKVWGEIRDIVAVFNNGHRQLYVNGILKLDYAPERITNVNATFGPTFIGNLSGALFWHQTFDGIIYDVRLWNKALTYEKTTTNRADLMLEFLFDEQQGTIAYDTSGHGNHGTLKQEARWIPGP